MIGRVRSVIGSARRLHSDAHLLAEHGRFTSGFALALLSIEELGKILIELWGQDEWWETPMPTELKTRLSFHVRKQMAFAALLFAGEVIDSTRNTASESFDAEQFKALYRDVFDRGDASNLLIEAMFGVLNRRRESAFYMDNEP